MTPSAYTEDTLVQQTTAGYLSRSSAGSRCTPITTRISGRTACWAGIVGLVSTLLGLTITNLLTYGGVILIAVAGILAWREFILREGFALSLSLAAALGVFVGVTVAMSFLYDYNLVQGFLTTVSLENPDGFEGFRKPWEYLGTRIEGICEILLFLSFGFSAMLFHPDRLDLSWSDWRRDDVAIMLSGMVALLVVLVSGAYRTGETARGALFIYPYIMLALTNANPMLLRNILMLAGLQTVGMQLLGGYFW